ncbi:MAG: HEAT repeat domain-containing protein [Polyangiaceae bacterium]|nr:HEAT repeat domain-containing protein [Polyangiaceae bacterium]
MLRSLLLAPFAIALVLAVGPSRAETKTSDLHRVIPAGGGLSALDVTVDPALRVVRARSCAVSDCTRAAAFLDVPIPMDPARIDLANVEITSIAIGNDKHVAHVRVPDAQRKDLAFEAVLSSQAAAPIFADFTGFAEGSEGDRRGHMIRIFDRDETSKFVIVADSREDTRICGQSSTMLSPRGLDPKTMQLRAATLHRIDKQSRDGAERVLSRARHANDRPVLARILVATGASAPGAAALTDGNIDSTWSEQRPGDGHGEFVTMRAPAELPIDAFAITVAPPSLPKASQTAGAAPKTFFLATDDRLFHVTMPEDAWQKPGASYEIPLPHPVRTTCVAIVLDEAYAQTKAAPKVTIAEISALTKFDTEGATLGDVAKALGSSRADEAAALLKRTGDEGVAAVVGVYATLDDKGRALAIDVAASAAQCTGPSIGLMTRALADKDAEVRRRALGRVERCGSAALEPLADVMGIGTPETRRTVRNAFARAARSGSRDELSKLLGRRQASPAARRDLLRAMGPKLAELRPESDMAVTDLLRASPDMATRYLLAEPLAHLARSQDAMASERLAEFARRDPAWPVRARAVEVSSGIPALLPIVRAAADDPEPRVREAALQAIASSSDIAGRDAAAHALAGDEWTFVRVAAAEAIGALPADSSSSGALGRALTDASANVRVAAMTSLGKLRAIREAPRVRARLDDAEEDTEVRALAARTLGVMCVQNATGRLTKLAERLRAPRDEADERIGVAAIDALAMLHPMDLPKRLAPLVDKNVRMPVRRAAERALAEPGSCGQ